MGTLCGGVSGRVSIMIIVFARDIIFKRGYEVNNCILHYITVTVKESHCI